MGERPGLKDRVTGAVARLRERRPLVDHLVRMQEHYGQVKASQQAGGVTYFGFLSFFPILALAFFVVGYVAQVYPRAEGDLLDALDSVLPGLVGGDEGQIPLDSIRDAAGAVGLVGLVGVLYSGTGWISSLREALWAVFEEPRSEQPSFVLAKLRDVLALGVLGVGLLLSVAVSGVVVALSTQLLDLLGLDEALAPLLRVLAVAVGVLANTLLFTAIFLLLARPDVPRRSVLQGALLGAVGFEVLKQAATFLLASTRGQPAFQAFGIALVLLVWINYFSRVVLYAAAFAHTSPAARAEREARQALEDAPLVAAAGSPAAAAARRGPWRESFVRQVDAADPDEVGEATAAASRAAVDAGAGRNRLLALGAAGTAVGIAAVAALRRRS